MDRKSQILKALEGFIRQRPGLEFGNYGDRTAYFSEMRRITMQRHDAERLIRAVALSSMPAERAIAFAEAAGVFVALVLLFVYGRP